MNAGTLLENFDVISEAPDAIPQLRRFILDLAVRGKLVDQDPNDEPANELLKWIIGTKLQIATQRSIHQDKNIEFSVSRDVVFSPTGWVWPYISDVAFVQGGKRLPQGASFSPEETPHIYIRVTDMKDGTIVTDNLRFITPDVQHQISRYTINKEDLYITIAGTIGQVGTVPKYFDGHNLTENAAKIVFPILNPDYFRLALSSTSVQDQFREKTKQMAQPKLALKRIAGVQFPLPPLAEQHRIVARVDELMFLCDKLEAEKAEREQTRDRLVSASLHYLNPPAEDVEANAPEALREHARFVFNNLPRLTTRTEHIRQLRETIVNLAIRGKLVEQDVNSEPAEKILERINPDKVMTAEKFDSQSSGNDTELPFTLPAGWTWARFPELGKFGRGKSKHRPRNDPALYEGGSHPFVQTGDVARSNGVIDTFTSQYNDQGLAQSEKWPEGTLCITIAANIADSGILGFDACFPDSVVGFIPASMFPNAKYFEYYVRSLKKTLTDFAPATAQKNINLSILNALLIPLPPLEEQTRIVAKVDELMALCDQLEARITTTEADSLRLLKSVLHEALEPDMEEVLA